MAEQEDADTPLEHEPQLTVIVKPSVPPIQDESGESEVSDGIVEHVADVTVPQTQQYWRGGQRT